jgi:hypothetical protein
MTTQRMTNTASPLNSSPSRLFLSHQNSRAWRILPVLAEKFLQKCPRVSPHELQLTVESSLWRLAWALIAEDVEEIASSGARCQETQSSSPRRRLEWSYWSTSAVDAVGQWPHHCHTGLSEGNQVHTYMHARIKFHAYSDIKVNTETVSHKKKKDYQRFTLNPGNEGSKHHRQSTGGCVRLAPATTSQVFRVASSLWATLFIPRVSTCRTQQVWGKTWMQRLYSGLDYKHLSNFSWSSFISTWLLIKYKFIPTHIKHKVRGTP